MLFAQFANILFFWLATVHCCFYSQQTVSPSDDVLQAVSLNFSVHKNGKEHSGWVECELLNEDTPTSLPFANVEIVENNTKTGCRWRHSEANYDTVRYKRLCGDEFITDLGRNDGKTLSIKKHLTKRIGSESKNLVSVVKLSRNLFLENTFRAFDAKNVDVTQRSHSVKLPSRGEWYVYTQTGVRDSDLPGMSSTQLDKTYGEVKDWCDGALKSESSSSEDEVELPPSMPLIYKLHSVLPYSDLKREDPAAFPPWSSSNGFSNSKFIWRRRATFNGKSHESPHGSAQVAVVAPRVQGLHNGSRGSPNRRRSEERPSSGRHIKWEQIPQSMMTPIGERKTASTQAKVVRTRKVQHRHANAVKSAEMI